MPDRNDVESLTRRLAEHHQEHLLAFWGELSPQQRDRLIEDIEELDFTKICDWVANLVKGEPQPPVLHKDFEPAPSYTPVPRSPEEKRKYAQAVALGERMIAEGKVAALTVAGGQGTRLGFEGPKGNFPISPIRQKTLFRIFAETIAAVSQRYGATCPWYIMTSPLNHEPTREIFKADNYYGLDPRNVFIFQQGTLPNFAFDGRILLADKNQIARSPDGHGGCIPALARRMQASA